MLPQSPLREPETWTTQDLANVETPTVESKVLITDEISQLVINPISLIDPIWPPQLMMMPPINSDLESPRLPQ